MVVDDEHFHESPRCAKRAAKCRRAAGLSTDARRSLSWQMCRPTARAPSALVRASRTSDWQTRQGPGAGGFAVRERWCSGVGRPDPGSSCSLAWTIAPVRAHAEHGHAVNGRPEGSSRRSPETMRPFVVIESSRSANEAGRQAFEEARRRRLGTPDAKGRHWITSSARPSSDRGIVRPSAWAVFRLITSSNVVGCSTGRSAGFAPLRILSTKLAALRQCHVSDEI